MRIVHVTPHLPPDQAANALLPFQLGEWARARGDSVHYVAHPPAFAPGRFGEAGAAPSEQGEARPDVTWIPRTKRSLLAACDSYRVDRGSLAHQA